MRGRSHRTGALITNAGNAGNTHLWELGEHEWLPYTHSQCGALYKPWPTREHWVSRGRPSLRWKWGPLARDQEDWRQLISDTLQYISNKTIFFSGDSNTEAQFTSLVCLLQTSVTVDKIKSGDLSYHYKIFSTTTSLIFLRQDRLVQKRNCRLLCQKRKQNQRKQPQHCIQQCQKHHLDTSKVAANFQTQLSLYRPSIILLNVGAHFSRGKHGSEARAAIAFTQTVQTVFEHVCSLTWSPTLIWRLSHVNLYSDGDWDSKGSCSSSRPQNLDSVPDLLINRTRFQNSFVQRHLGSASENCYAKVLDTYSMSLHRADALCGRLPTGIWDCTHFCSPGLTDLWNILFLRQVNTIFSPTLPPPSPPA